MYFFVKICLTLTSLSIAFLFTVGFPVAVVENKEATDKEFKGQYGNRSEENRGVGITMAYEPAGDGLFRDPLEVLGPKFPACVALNTCELELLMSSNEINNVVFTERGKNTCKDVCRQYHTNIRLEGAPEVTLTEAYCDYTGVIAFRDDQEPELSSVCTCAYMVRCNRRTQIISYLFQANPAGFLKVKMTETSVPKDIT